MRARSTFPCRHRASCESIAATRLSYPRTDLHEGQGNPSSARSLESQLNRLAGECSGRKKVDDGEGLDSCNGARVSKRSNDVVRACADGAFGPKSIRLAHCSVEIGYRGSARRKKRAHSSRSCSTSHHACTRRRSSRCAHDSPDHSPLHRCCCCSTAHAPRVSPPLQHANDEHYADGVRLRCHHCRNSCRASWEQNWR